ncbi:dehydratase [Litorivita pollutaquae]|uniref:Dehydratase n=2 Tax=Litorivita pollutaquae TaxID=2200892 RepID=A0A2V4MSA0_9RHOB|nr:dehydratase [Rhodobacterales bacterium 59_46_T64]PYC48419.1 dehydratase [Litorivita pollutaquae]
MTETDVVNFCMLTGNWLELHSNVEHAKSSLYGQRLVQGSLVFSIVNAMIPFDSSVLAAFYGCDKLRFLRPTFIGDTLWARVEVADLKDHDENHGVVTSKLEGINQRDETVLRCQFSLLIRKSRLDHPGEPPKIQAAREESKGENA